MIVKSLARKQDKHVFRDLIQYMDREGVEDSFTHNLVTEETENIIQEFEANAALLPSRINGNYLYHDILSFSDDETNISKEAMVTLAREYIQLRASTQMVYMRIHMTNNPHIHCCISAGNLIGQRVSLSKAKFNNIKKDLEQIQKKQFPELCVSIVQDRKRPALRKTRKEQEAERRTKSVDQKPWQPTKKNIAIEAAKQAFIAPSHANCLSILKRRGFSLYERKGKVVGIKDTNDRKYRLKTLQVDELFQLAVQRWQMLEKDKRLKSRELELCRERSR